MTYFTNTTINIIEPLKWQGLKCKAKDIYIDFNNEKNNKGPNFKAVDHVRISKY